MLLVENFRPKLIFDFGISLEFYCKGTSRAITQKLIPILHEFLIFNLNPNNSKAINSRVTNVTQPKLLNWHEIGKTGCSYHVESALAFVSYVFHDVIGALVIICEN